MPWQSGTLQAQRMLYIPVNQDDSVMYRASLATLAAGRLIDPTSRVRYQWSLSHGSDHLQLVQLLGLHPL